MARSDRGAPSSAPAASMTAVEERGYRFETWLSNEESLEYSDYWNSEQAERDKPFWIEDGNFYRMENYLAEIERPLSLKKRLGARSGNSAGLCAAPDAIWPRASSGPLPISCAWARSTASTASSTRSIVWGNSGLSCLIITVCRAKRPSWCWATFTGLGFRTDRSTSCSCRPPFTIRIDLPCC